MMKVTETHIEFSRDGLEAPDGLTAAHMLDGTLTIIKSPTLLIEAHPAGFAKREGRYVRIWTAISILLKDGEQIDMPRLLGVFETTPELTGTEAQELELTDIAIQVHRLIDTLCFMHERRHATKH